MPGELSWWDYPIEERREFLDGFRSTTEVLPIMFREYPKERVDRALDIFKAAVRALERRFESVPDKPSAA